MNNINYIEIDTNLFFKNIDYVKNNYKYSYYILDVSNNAFNHGMYLINYINQKIDYLYVNNFQDLLLIRKYNKDVSVIYNGDVNENNIYDLIINNAIIVVHAIDTLYKIKELNIKDVVSFIFFIDPNGIIGIDNKNDILKYLEWNNKYFNLLGIMGKVEEKYYDDFKYIIKPINNSKLVILNNENDKKRICNSNAILLDSSFYGINNAKKSLFQRSSNNLKQIFTLKSRVVKIKKIIERKQNKSIAVIPFGYKHGMNKAIKFVYINGKLYSITNLFDEFAYIEVDNSIKTNMIVEIISANNPLENYLKEQTLNYFSLFNSNIPIVFDDYILEKTLIY